MLSNNKNNLLSSNDLVINYSTLPTYSMADVQKHDNGVTIKALKISIANEDDDNVRQKLIRELDLYSERGWLVINGLVIDVTDFQWQHPAGQLVIQRYICKDATDAFKSIHHSDYSKNSLKPLVVGKLEGFQGDFGSIFRK